MEAATYSGVKAIATERRRDLPNPIFVFPLPNQERAGQTADVSQSYRLPIYQNDSAMGLSFFSPDLEQRRNGPQIVRYQRKRLRRCLAQAHGVLLPEERPAFPLRHRMHSQSRIAPANLGTHFGRDVLVKKKLEHSRLF